MTYMESVLGVLVVGLILGAGVPVVFAGGLVAYSRGAGGDGIDGAAYAPNPALRILGLLLFVFVDGRNRGGDPVDHESDDHPPLRCRPVPVHPQEMSCE